MLSERSMDTCYAVAQRSLCEIRMGLPLWGLSKWHNWGWGPNSSRSSFPVMEQNPSTTRTFTWVSTWRWNIYTGLPFSIIILRKYVAALSCAHVRHNRNRRCRIYFSPTIQHCSHCKNVHPSTIRLFYLSDWTMIKDWKACTWVLWNSGQRES
jgi:hypothetical protein